MLDLEPMRCKCGVWVLAEGQQFHTTETSMHGRLRCTQIKVEDADTLLTELLPDDVHFVEPGRKDDMGKLPWDLLPWGPVQEIVQVLQHGAVKYSPDNWKTVENHRGRYFSAMIRHLTAWWHGEKTDPESKLPHLAHAGCCLLFLMWFDGRPDART
jgi:hypothetical protein